MATNPLVPPPSYPPPPPLIRKLQEDERIARLKRARVTLPTQVQEGISLPQTPAVPAPHQLMPPGTYPAPPPSSPYITPEEREDIPWYQMPIIPVRFSDAAETAMEQRLQSNRPPWMPRKLNVVEQGMVGIAKGTGDFLDTLNSPLGMTLIGGVMLTTGLPPSIVTGLIKAGFTGMGIQGLIQSAPHVKESFENGDVEEGVRGLTHAILSSDMAVKGARSFNKGDLRLPAKTREGLEQFFRKLVYEDPTMIGNKQVEGRSGLGRLAGEETGALTIKYRGPEDTTVAQQNVLGPTVDSFGEITPKGAVPGVTTADVTMTAPPVGAPHVESAQAMRAMSRAGIEPSPETVVFRNEAGEVVPWETFAETYPPSPLRPTLATSPRTAGGQISYSKRPRADVATPSAWDKYLADTKASVSPRMPQKGERYAEVPGEPAPTSTMEPAPAPTVEAPTTPTTPTTPATSATPPRASDMLRILEEQFPGLPLETYMAMIQAATKTTPAAAPPTPPAPTPITPTAPIAAKPAPPAPTPSVAAPSTPPVTPTPTKPLPPTQSIQSTQKAAPLPKPAPVEAVKPVKTVKPAEELPVEQPVETPSTLPKGGDRTLVPYRDVDTLIEMVEAGDRVRFSHITKTGRPIKGELIGYDPEANAFEYFRLDRKGNPMAVTDEPLLLDVNTFLAKGRMLEEQRGVGGSRYYTIADENLVVGGPKPVIPESRVLYGGGGKVFMKKTNTYTTAEVDGWIKRLEVRAKSGDSTAKYLLHKIKQNREQIPYRKPDGSIGYRPGGLTTYDVSLGKGYARTKIRRPQKAKESQIPDYNTGKVHDYESRFIDELDAKYAGEEPIHKSSRDIPPQARREATSKAYVEAWREWAAQMKKENIRLPKELKPPTDPKYNPDYNDIMVFPDDLEAVGRVVDLSGRTDLPVGESGRAVAPRQIHDVTKATREEIAERMAKGTGLSAETRVNAEIVTVPRRRAWRETITDSGDVRIKKLFESPRAELARQLKALRQRARKQHDILAQRGVEDPASSPIMKKIFAEAKEIQRKIREIDPKTTPMVPKYEPRTTTFRAKWEGVGPSKYSEFPTGANVDEYRGPASLPSYTGYPPLQFGGPEPMYRVRIGTSPQGKPLYQHYYGREKPPGKPLPKQEPVAVTRQTIAQMKADLKQWEAAEAQAGVKIKAAEELRKKIARAEKEFAAFAGTEAAPTPRPPSAPTIPPPPQKMPAAEARRVIEDVRKKR